MKRFFLIFTFLIVNHTIISAQGCLPDGITFSTQSEIDDFQNNYPGCTEIEGTVQIDGSDIINLNGLNSINRIGGSLYIRYCNNLVTLHGLHTLTFVGGSFVSILENNSLVNLEGLNNLSKISGILSLFQNNSMTNLIGLESLTRIGEDFNIQNMSSLTSITGLSLLDSIGGNLYILYNNSLINLYELNTLSVIQGKITIQGNDVLTDIIGLDGINSASISSLNIFSNSSLSTCAIESICNYLATPNGEIFITNNASGCNNQQEVEEACKALNVMENKNNYHFSIYPNPARDFISISGNNDRQFSEINFYDFSGRLVLKKNPSNIFNISSLKKGLYFVELVYGNRKTRQKLIVN